MLISIINILLKNYTYDVINLNFSLIANKVDFYMKVPISIFAVIISIVCIIIFISSKISMKKVTKANLIETIKNAENINVVQKQLKSSKLLEKLLSIEGVISYKEIKRDKSRYKAIVISLTASIILFLGVTGFVDICYKTDLLGGFLAVSTSDNFNDCEFNFSKTEKTDELINYLKSNNLINDYCLYDLIDRGSIRLTDKEISSDIRKLIEDGIYKVNENREMNINSIIVCYGDKAYSTLLKKVGISELKDNETIIINQINGEAKYGKKLNLTNYKEGDSYKVNIEGKEKELKIAEIVEDFKPYNVVAEGSIAYPVIVQMVNEKTFDELIKIQGYFSLKYNLAVDTDKTVEIEKRRAEIEEIFDGDIFWQSSRLIGESMQSQKAITDIIINSFIGLLALISGVNIFNTISSSILLRKKEFAELKSIGMSNKQINKMLILEGIFYGMDSIFFGVAISVFLLFIMHMRIVNTLQYKFTIPLINILICIIAIYIIIFTAIIYAKNKIKNKNMIDEIKDENI